MSKVYEKITKIQNKTIHNKLSEMQAAGQHDNVHHCNNKCNHWAEKNREKKHANIFCRCSTVFWQAVTT